MVMKLIEMLLRQKLLEMVGKSHPMQFADRAGTGVEDAIITLLHFLYKKVIWHTCQTFIYGFVICIYILSASTPIKFYPTTHFSYETLLISVNLDVIWAGL